MNDFIRKRMPDGPALYRSGMTDSWPILKSSRDLASIDTASLVPGYPVLQRGVLLSQNRARAGKHIGKYVPYAPEVYGGQSAAPQIAAGRAPVLETVASGAKVVKVLLEHAKRFAIGDDLVICQKGSLPENLGAIQSINLSTGPFGILTASNPTSKDFTTANEAFARVSTGWAATVTADLTDAATSCKIANKDVDLELLVPGKTLFLASSTVAAKAVGTIVSVLPGTAETTIGFSSATGVALTTATGVMAYIGGCRRADGILLDERNPGDGSGGDGGMGNICFGRADVVLASLGNIDNEAVQDLGGKIRHGLFIF